jgi:hypothetical protein
MSVSLGSSMFVCGNEIAAGAGTKCVNGNWSHMTDVEILKKRRAALRAYARKANADPAGARKRLIATGIYTTAGELRPEFGGEPAKAKA